MTAAIQRPGLPLGIKLYAGAVGLFGLFFAFSSYFNPAQIAPTALLDNPATRLAFGTVGATVLGLSLGLFLAVGSNHPHAMLLMLVVRVFVAVLDLANALVLGLGLALAAFQAVIIFLGAVSVFTLFSQVRAAERQGS